MNEVLGQPVMDTYQENCGVEMTEEYKPSRSECLRDYEIRIRFLSIGCIIEIGCKSIPFTSISEGMAALNSYIAEPFKMRKVWEEKLRKEE